MTVTRSTDKFVTSLILPITLAFSAAVLLVNCAQYRTRAFVTAEMTDLKHDALISEINSPTLSCKATLGYELCPVAWAYIGSAVNPNQAASFLIDLNIRVLSPAIPKDVLSLAREHPRFEQYRKVVAESLVESLSIDSIKLVLLPGDSTIWAGFRETAPPRKVIWGAEFYFELVNIEPQFDSVALEIPLRVTELSTSTIHRDTMVFKLYRHESSSIGPLLH